MQSNNKKRASRVALMFLSAIATLAQPSVIFAKDNSPRIIHLSPTAARAVEQSLRDNATEFNAAQYRQGSHDKYLAIVTTESVRFPVFSFRYGNQDLSAGKTPSTILCTYPDRGTESVACVVIDRGEAGNFARGQVEISDRLVARLIFEGIAGPSTVIQRVPLAWIEEKSIGNVVCRMTEGYAQEFRCRITAPFMN